VEGLPSIDVATDAAVAVASAHAAAVGAEVAGAVRAYLPITAATASKAALDSQAMRIGAIIARWFFDDIESGVRSRVHLALAVHTADA
jgi:hypothetical protein